MRKYSTTLEHFQCTGQNRLGRGQSVIRSLLHAPHPVIGTPICTHTQLNGERKYIKGLSGKLERQVLFKKTNNIIPQLTGIKRTKEQEVRVEDIVNLYKVTSHSYNRNIKKK